MRFNRSSASAHPIAQSLPFAICRSSTAVRSLAAKCARSESAVAACAAPASAAGGQQHSTCKLLAKLRRQAAAAGLAVLAAAVSVCTTAESDCSGATEAGPWSGDGAYQRSNKDGRAETFYFRSFADGTVKVYDEKHRERGTGTVNGATVKLKIFDGIYEATARKDRSITWSDGDVWRRAR